MPLSARILAAIFDMDGVLTDSEPLINAAAIEMFRQRNCSVLVRVSQTIGTGQVHWE